MSQLDTSAPPGDRVAKTFPGRAKKRSFLGDLFESPVSLKWIMALTGIVGLGYVLVHMIGNLHVYEGPRQIFQYAEALRDLGGHLAPRGLILWLLRMTLLLALIVHVYASWKLTVVNHKARPTRYQSKRDYIAADYASRTMRYTGIWLAFFILFHLADLTWGRVDSDFVQGDPYHNIYASMENPFVAVFYILSMLFLGLHIFHGAWSIFQSLGINSPRYNSWRRGFAGLFTLVIVLGNISFPIAVQAGLIDEDDRCWPNADQIRFLEETGDSVEGVEEALAQQGVGLCDIVDQIPSSVEQYEEQLQEIESQQLVPAPAPLEAPIPSEEEGS